MHSSRLKGLDHRLGGTRHEPDHRQSKVGNPPLLLQVFDALKNHSQGSYLQIEIAENPSKFYESLNYNDKRIFQNILYPEGFKFSLKNKEFRTSKVNIIFYLTKSFKVNYSVKKNQIQNYFCEGNVDILHKILFRKTLIMICKIIINVTSLF